MSFVLRSGDLGGTSEFSGPNRALEGTRGHQRLQKSRPAGYQSEVAVSHRTELAEFVFELKGRIDGVLVENGTLLIEEIKTVSSLATRLEPDPLHWAQAKIYACLYARENGFPKSEVQITYLSLETFETSEFRETFTISALISFFEDVVTEYLEWLSARFQWIQTRNRFIADLAFPFDSYRPGQRALAVAVYRSIKSRERLFAEAPTGIGKTLSVLFPAIKAMGEDRIEKIFYTTAKTIGRTVAEDTLTDLRRKGLRLKSVTLTAKDKICFNSGQPCDLRTCPFAIGYYDRIKSALKAALEHESFSRLEIEELARAHQVCPFELSLDLSYWADVVICDYNYVFDPTVSLKRFFSGEKQEFAILIDEAHNLVERAREMYSADLEKAEILTLKSLLADALPGCARLLTRLNTRLLKLKNEEGWLGRQGKLVHQNAPERLAAVMREFCREAERWLVRNELAEYRQALLDLYFRFNAFLRVTEIFDSRYRTIFDLESGRLRLFCIDPSSQIREALDELGSAVFFSATLTPIEYFVKSLGGEMGQPCLKLESPFPTANLGILVHSGISTRLRNREAGYDEIVASLAAMAGAKMGNYLVYFSSYEYLHEVRKRFSERYPGIETFAQKTNMPEAEREEFLVRFQADSARTLVGFAVLGGVFGEGIDLVGERLIGVAVIGVGLPQLCLERDLICDYWQDSTRAGFDFAYTYPGMNRVLQAVGRVIRSENDRGVVLLMDDRFQNSQYSCLFPKWWTHRKYANANQVGQAATEFWSGHNG